MRKIEHPTRILMGLAVVGALIICAVVVRAQAPGFGSVKDFSLPEFYDPPNQNQVKTLVRGTEAKFQSDGQLTVTELKAEFFRPNGERELTISTPECLYDSSKREGSSTNRLSLESGDGRVLVEGVGFLWRQNESTLIISNRVHTVVRSQPAKRETSKQ